MGKNAGLNTSTSMSQNITPINHAPLVALAEDVADGAQQHEASIGLLQNTAARIRDDRAALTSAESALLARRAAKSAAAAALRAADGDAGEFIALFLHIGKMTLGRTWNVTWEQAGFSGGSLAAPRLRDARFAMLGAMRDFLGGNPQFETTDANHPELALTAARASAIYEAISTARSALNQSEVDNSAALAARDSANVALRHRITGLREELGQLISGDDPRWLAFGFNRPADPDTPEVPDSPTVAPGVPGSGILIVNWPRARRATGYKLLALLQGATTPLDLGRFADNHAVITLPTGTPAQIQLLAYNTHGYSPPGEPVQVIAP